MKKIESQENKEVASKKLEDFIQAHFHSLYAYAHSILRRYGESKYVAEDLIQDVIVKLYDLLLNKPNFIEGEKLLKYTMVMMRNSAIDYIRRNKKYELELNLDELSESEIPTIKNEFLSKETYPVIDDFLNQILTKDENNIFVLYYYTGLNIKELAETTNSTPGSIRVKLQRLRRKFKRYLEENEVKFNNN